MMPKMKKTMRMMPMMKTTMRMMPKMQKTWRMTTENSSEKEGKDGSVHTENEVY